MIKEIAKSLTFVRSGVRKLLGANSKGSAEPLQFPRSRSYWQDRYASGGNSGAGSYGELAEFKAEILNQFVSENDIRTVIEFGCGDGNQLTLAHYPMYRGLDVSPTAIARCRTIFEGDRTKSFDLLDANPVETADLALSLDVIYHLVEDRVFEEHMRRLFAAATRFVVIYSSNSDENSGYENSHVRQREFTTWVDRNCPGWSLTRHVPNRFPYDTQSGQGSFASFHFFAPKPRA